MKKFWVIVIVVACISGFTMCNKADVFPESSYDDRLSGGLATAFDETSKAFSHAVDGLNERDMEVHELGDAAFEQTFVSAPAPVNSGLGPVFNNVSCISCHHNDGKGTPTAGFQHIIDVIQNKYTRRRCKWWSIGCSWLWRTITGPGCVW
jgi:CxxC motif-containing protein (DUF1111 family)